MDESPEWQRLRERIATVSYPKGLTIPYQATPPIIEAALKGSVDLCRLALYLEPYVPSRAFEYAALGGSVACMHFLLSVEKKISQTGKSNVLQGALYGTRPIEMIGYLLEHARFTLHDWNPALYRSGETVPEWAWDLQRRLAARQLGHQAAKRALKHAGVHKDVIPLICQMILKSEVGKW